MPSIASSVNSTDPRNSWCPVTIPSSHQRSSFGVVTVLSLVGPKATCCGPNVSSGPGTWWFGVVRLPLRHGSHGRRGSSRIPRGGRKSHLAPILGVPSMRRDSLGASEMWEIQDVDVFNFLRMCASKICFFSCNTFSETESSRELLRFQKVQMALMALSTCRQCCCVGRISELHRVGLCRSSGWDLTSAWDAAVTTSAVLEWLNCNCPHTIRNSG